MKEKGMLKCKLDAKTGNKDSAGKIKAVRLCEE
jgi:hypothetical protein